MQKKSSHKNEATGLKISLEKLPDTDLVILNISKNRASKSIEVLISEPEALIVALEYDIPINPPVFEVL